MNTLVNAVNATLVDDENRMNFLPSSFGINLMLVGENCVYNWMARLSDDYKGGFWNFYTLTNGGFYMAPHMSTMLNISVTGNYYESEVSADAAGIIATLFALCQMANQFADERLIDMYHFLRDYVCEHPEASKIYAAID